MKLLLSSYSLGADRGSEAGVGWNIACGMAARGHDVTVLTTSEYHEENFRSLNGLPLRILEYDFGIRKFASASSYNHWQRRITSVIRGLCASESFDLIHHVTFNQYRGLRDVFAADLPYVIGPIGGAELVPLFCMGEMPLRARMKEVLRYVPFDAIPLGIRVRNSGNKGIVLASTPQTKERLQKYALTKEALELLPAIAVKDSEIAEPQSRCCDAYIMFEGGGRPGKGIKLFIRALSILWQRGVKVPAKITAVSESARVEVQKYMRKVDLPDCAVILMPYVQRTRLMSELANAAAFVSLSYRDSGCMALLEAVACGVPTLCLDTPSQFWLPPEYAIKMPVVKKMEGHLADAIEKLLRQPSASANLSEERAEWARTNMSWKVRVEHIEHVYEKLLKTAKL